MKLWYVYVIDRSFEDHGYRSHETVFAEIYEAESKDDAKKLLLEDVDYLAVVRMRVSDKIPQYERFITNIYELNDSWRDIWLQKHSCKQCRNEYTKIEKKKFGTRGAAEFCSIECQKEDQLQFAPVDITTYDTATIYMITHRPTGRHYIGVTTRWIMQRWWEHIKAKSGSPFHQLVQTSSITDFTFEILEVFKPSEHNPYEREAFYISKYNAVELGLNSVNGHVQEVIDV